eukprot:596842-Pleurochrysis_carterae.AAC.1
MVWLTTQLETCATLMGSGMDSIREKTDRMQGIWYGRGRQKNRHRSVQTEEEREKSMSLGGRGGTAEGRIRQRNEEGSKAGDSEGRHSKVGRERRVGIG